MFIFNCKLNAVRVWKYFDSFGILGDGLLVAVCYFVIFMRLKNFFLIH